MSLPLTGERTVPGVQHENYWFRRHEIAYRDCARRIAASGGVGRVLDAGAGEGYGTAIISELTGAVVTAVDYAHDAIAHACRNYGLPAVRGNLVAMPFRDAAFDAVVSMQTIEHLWDQPAFVTESARLLRPGGLLVITTPNRLTFPPGNVFHSRELSALELSYLITPPFEIVLRLGVHHGSRLDERPGLVDDQLASEPSDWPEELATLVAGITAYDFVINADVETCLDLYFVAVRT